MQTVRLISIPLIGLAAAAAPLLAQVAQPPKVQGSFGVPGVAFPNGARVRERWIPAGERRSPVPPAAVGSAQMFAVPAIGAEVAARSLPPGFTLGEGSALRIGGEVLVSGGVSQKTISLFSVRYRGIPLAKGSDALTVIAADGRVLSERLRNIPSTVETIAVKVPAGPATETAIADMRRASGLADLKAGAPLLQIWVNAEQQGFLAWDLVVSSADLRRPAAVEYWVSAVNGKILARENAIYTAYQGDARGDAWLTTPLQPTTIQPLERISVTGNMPGTNAVTNSAGHFTVSGGTGDIIFTGGLAGATGVVVNKAGAAMTATGTGSPTSPASLVFAGTGEFERGQISGYHWVNQAEDFASPILVPGEPRLASLPINVNIANVCNAFWSPDPSHPTVNFFRAGSGCPNTAYSDVAMHEMGHGVDQMNGGILSGGYSEGFGDVLAMLRTRQPCSGRDFFGAGTCLRDATAIFLWPTASTSPDPHRVGQPYGEFVWETVQRLGSTMTLDQAFGVSTQLAFGAAKANPASVPDAVRLTFVADDDDGSLHTCSAHQRILEQAADSRSLPRPPDCSNIFPEPDFNGDKHADILWRNYKTGENSIWLMNGTTPSAFLLTQPNSNPNWQMAASGDFNNDGKPDILWRNCVTGENSIWLMNGTHPTQFLLIQKVPDLNWQIGGTGDFNNDGKVDILWRNYKTGENSIWLMNGFAPTAFLLTKKVPDLNWRMAGSGDFNGDGKADILWRNTSTGENSIWLMDGINPTQFLLIQKVPDLSWQMAGSADFNGDGNSDILWRNITTGENSIWLMNGIAPAQFLKIQQVIDRNWEMAGIADTDHDTLPDGFERGMLDKFRPFYRFSLDDGPDRFHPADADGFVRSSALLDSPVVGGGSDQLVSQADLSQDPAKALRVNTSTWGPSDQRGLGPLKVTPYRLDLADNLRNGEPDFDKVKKEAVGLYGHVSWLPDDTIKIEFWQFFAFNDAPVDEYRHEGDWETLQLHVEPDGSALRTIIHEVHGRRIVFNLPGANSADIGGGIREFTGTGANRPHRAYIDLHVDGPAGIGWAQENLVRTFCVDGQCTHPVVNIEHSGHAFWPAPFWSWPGARKHNGDGEAFLVATPPNLGEIGASNLALPGADIIVHYNGHWGAKNDGPEGPGLKGSWGKP